MNTRTFAHQKQFDNKFTRPLFSWLSKGEIHYTHEWNFISQLSFLLFPIEVQTLYIMKTNVTDLIITMNGHFFYQSGKRMVISFVVLWAAVCSLDRGRFYFVRKIFIWNKLRNVDSTTVLENIQCPKHLVRYTDKRSVRMKWSGLASNTPNKPGDEWQSRISCNLSFWSK